MKRALMLITFLEGLFIGVVVGLIMPAEQREKLSRSLLPPLERWLAQMPDG